MAEHTAEEFSMKERIGGDTLIDNKRTREEGRVNKERENECGGGDVCAAAS